MEQRGEAEEYLTGDGEMRRLLRAHGWSATPLGPVEDWPQSLKIVVRMLVVDDNRDAAASVVMMFKLMGNEAGMTHDGPETLDVAAAFRPDLISWTSGCHAGTGTTPPSESGSSPGARGRCWPSPSSL